MQGLETVITIVVLFGCAYILVIKINFVIAYFKALMEILLTFYKVNIIKSCVLWSKAIIDYLKYSVDLNCQFAIITNNPFVCPKIKQQQLEQMLVQLHATIVLFIGFHVNSFHANINLNERLRHQKKLRHQK